VDRAAEEVVQLTPDRAGVLARLAEHPETVVQVS